MPVAATVRGGTLFYEQQYTFSTLKVGTADWYNWLHTAILFTVEDAAGTFTVRREQSGNGRGKSYWRAYARENGILRRVYLGKTENLTSERLQEVAAQILHHEPVFSATKAPSDPEERSQRALLLTKLHVPHLPTHHIARERLRNQLQQILQYKLTFISAPAGFGKTTLLSEWASTHASSVAWFSLDHADNDSMRFWAYVVTALEPFVPGIRVAMASLLSSPLLPCDVLLTSLLNALSSAAISPWGLVLDDFHVITSQSLHDALAFLLEHLPSQAHLIIISRSETPFPLTRLRASRQLLELRADDLRFTLSETAPLLQKILGEQLAHEDLVTLVNKTEGWAVGLQLAALLRQEQAPSWLQTLHGNHHYINDYLIEEVLHNQPEQIQTFLLSTSILSRLNASLCIALLQNVQGGVLLDKLARAHFFLLSLDNEQQWYRYHYLFGEALRAHLQYKNALLLPELHSRASHWYEQHGFLNDAIHHALQGGNFARAVQLILVIAEEMIWVRGETLVLQEWCEALPNTIRQTSVEVSLYYAITLFLNHGPVGIFEQTLQQAEHALTMVQSSAIPVLSSRIKAMRSMIINNNAESSLSIARLALQELPEDAFIWRCIVNMNLGDAALFLDDVPLAKKAYTEAITNSRNIHHDYFTLQALCNLTALLMLEGALREAFTLCQETLSLASRQSLQHVPVLGYIYATLGRVTYEWNDLLKAEQYAQEAIDHSQGMYWQGYIMLARVKAAQGQSEQVSSLLLHVDALAQKHGDMALSTYREAQELRFRLREGKGVDMKQWLHRAISEQRPIDFLPQSYEFQRITFAQVLIAQDQYAEADIVVQQLLEPAMHVGRKASVIELFTLQAIIRYKQHQTLQALQLLVQALSLAELEGYTRLFVDQGHVLAQLLTELLQLQRRKRLFENISIAYLQSLLEAFEVTTSEQEDYNSQRSKIQLAAETISVREQEVLQLVIAGLSNSEIAERLVISVATVKKHLEHIYSKLNTHNRVQLVGIARTLGLLAHEADETTIPRSTLQK